MFLTCCYKPEVEEDMKTLDLFQRIPHVLKKVMGYLDYDSLKNARLVTRFWNKHALVYLSHRTGIKYDHIMTFLTKQERGPKKITEQNVDCLLKILEHSKAPHLLIKRFHYLDNYHVTEWHYSLEELFIKFGNYIEEMSFNITQQEVQTRYINLPIYHEILTSWCQNLKSLVFGLFETENTNLSKYVIHQQLQLETIQLWGQYFGPTISGCIMNILQSSPNLTTLKIKGVAQHDSYANKQFPLEKIYTHLNECQNIGPKLKTFHCGVLSKDNENYDQLIIFLKSLVKVLSLKLMVDWSCPHYKVIYMPRKSAFEGFRYNLRHLRCNNIFQLDKKTRLGILNCLDWFPNLDIFCNQEFFGHSKFRESPVEFKGLKSPHLKLTKLLLLHAPYEIKDVYGLRAIVESFPNLQFLHLDLNDNLFQEEGIISELTLEDYLTVLCELKELQELNIVLRVKEVVELTYPLKYITSFKNLQRLAIGMTNDSYRLDHSEAFYKPKEKDADYESNKDDHSNSKSSDESLFEAMNNFRIIYKDAHKFNSINQKDKDCFDSYKRSLEFLKTCGAFSGTRNLCSFRLFGKYDENFKKEMLDLAKRDRFPLVFGDWGDFRHEHLSWYNDYQSGLFSISTN